MPQPKKSKAQRRVEKLVLRNNERLAVGNHHLIPSVASVRTGQTSFRVATKGPSGQGRLRQHKH